MTGQNVIQSLDGIQIALGSCSTPLGIDFPQLGTGPRERVLVLNSNERIEVRDFPRAPYFSARGVLTDLDQGELPNSRAERTFPIDLSALPEVFQWPPAQQEPFDEPPVHGEHTTPPGPSKQAYFFGDGSSLVTVGPSLPKIAVLADGGAQFWVGSIAAITQGTGMYEGARGLAATMGSAYFARWPKSEKEQLERLQRGFNASVVTIFKLVLAAEVAGDSQAAAAERPAEPSTAAAPAPVAGVPASAPAGIEPPAGTESAPEPVASATTAPESAASKTTVAPAGRGPKRLTASGRTSAADAKQRPPSSRVRKPKPKKGK